MKKDYRVSITVTSTHEYRVPECNSPEEAESVAEAWFADGEEGTVEVEDIAQFDVVEDDGEEE